VGKERIYFFKEGIEFIISDKKGTRNWIREIINRENKLLGKINFIFCSDKYLLDINVKYLKHNFLTDVITFNLSEKSNIISGDIFISLDRVKENAISFKSNFITELRRVISHGLLHLIGYNDKTDEEEVLMREKEDYYLSLLTDFIR
jgi:probable rRNA maturation factor